MKDYKVGDKVWAKEHYNIPKGFYTIRNFTNNGFFIENENGISGSVFISGIHETADSMFEELGYEVENGKDYIEYRDEDNMREITIYTDEKTINCCYYDYEDELPLRFTMQEHQAIHQKLIELGWIE